MVVSDAAEFRDGSLVRAARRQGAKKTHLSTREKQELCPQAPGVNGTGLAGQDLCSMSQTYCQRGM